jgi:hypothetical protein
VRNLVLDTWALFEQTLFESPFFERLSIPRGENRQLACGILAEKLQKSGLRLRSLHERASFDKAWALLREEKVQKVFYRTDASRARFQSMIDEANADEFYRDHWSPATQLFREDREQARTVEKALNWLFSRDHATRPLLIVDLSREQATGMFWNDKIQALVIKRLLYGISQAAEVAYKDEVGLNTLVIIDEAHRLAPRQMPFAPLANMVLAGCLSARRFQAYTRKSCSNFASHFLGSASA